jgi:hypothetical protein
MPPMLTPGIETNIPHRIETNIPHRWLPSDSAISNCVIRGNTLA